MTKQEILNFLESKLGTKVVCVGNPSLDGQCVSLIKSLMELIGVPEPYKARGNAKDCIAKYISEGIAKPGTGFISVFSNKEMGGGFGHIWCNAGEGVGTFYESNGVKPLIVTKGKTYAYDSVCNFDQYITEDPCLSYKKELDEKREQIGNYDKQVAGLLGEKKQLTIQIDELNSQLGGVRGELASSIAKIDTQNKVISSYVNEDAVQLETLKAFQRERDELKNLIISSLDEISVLTKVARGSDTLPIELRAQIEALQRLNLSANDSIIYNIDKVISKYEKMLIL